MIELHAANMPSSQKPSIMLEEIGLPYIFRESFLSQGSRP
jgi:glutathione S-transferase